MYNEKAFIAPICVAVYEAVDAACMSGVAVATITKSIVVGSIFFFAIKSFAAFIAKNDDPSSLPFNILLSLIPEFVLTNKILESMVETNDQWIVSRTGIKERRILKGNELGSSFLAINAAKKSKN